MDADPPAFGIFTTDDQLIIRTWDDWLARVTGYPAEEAVGRPLKDLIPDLEERGFLDRFQRVLEEGVVEVLSPVFHRFLIPCPPLESQSSFEQMQQKVTLAPFREGERVVGLLVTIEDVTARMDQEKALAEDLAGPDEMKRLRAAQALAQQGGEADSLLQSISDESWRVRRMAVQGLARHGGAEAIISLIRTMRQEHRDLSTLNSALQVLAFSQIDILPPVVELLKDDDPELRLYVTQVISEKNDPRAIPPLIGLLKDEDPNVRYQAVEALGIMGAQEAVEPLMSLVESRDFFLAFPALEALIKIGNSSITERVIPFLSEEFLQDPAVRLIGLLGDEEVVPVLISLLNRSQAPAPLIALALTDIYDRYRLRFGEGGPVPDLTKKHIRAAGVKNLLEALPLADQEVLRPLALTLGWLGGPAVEKALTRLIGHPRISAEVVNSLVRYGSRVTELLIEQLGDEDLEVRQAAVIALGRIGDSKAVPALIRVLSEDPELIVVTAGALAKIGDRRAFEALLSLIGTPQAAIRQAVISALNSIAHPDMPKRIVSLLEDGDFRVRESAVRIAGYFGYPELMDRLLELSRDENEEVRRAVIENLPYLEDARVAPIMLAALKEDRPRVRASAAKALALVKGPLVRAGLVGALKDQDPWVRYFAVRSLTRLGGEGIMEWIVELAENDPSMQVRIAAMESLGRVGGEKALSVLNRFLDSEEYDLARAAIRAVGDLEHPAAGSALLRTLSKAGSAKKIDAIYALGKKGGEGAIEALQWAAATEKDEDVRQAALEALSRSEDQKAVTTLIGLTADPGLREYCVGALARAGQEKIEWIAQGLHHPQSKIRLAVIEALARMKKPGASEAMALALRDLDPAVRLSAITALDSLGSRIAREELAVLAQKDEDLRVRQAAAKMVGK